MQKLGGRKFILTLIAMAIGTAIEIYTTRGISPSFAGLLAGLITAFSAANWAVSKDHFKKVSAKGKETDNKTLEDIKNNIQAIANSQADVMQGIINTQQTSKATQTLTQGIATRMVQGG